jgi:hypothetical protein
MGIIKAFMFKLTVRNVLLALGLLGLALFASIRAMDGKKPEPVAAPASSSERSASNSAYDSLYTPGAAPNRPEFNAAEEAYSVSLRRIHGNVATGSALLGPTALSYKLKKLDRAGLKAKIASQSELYRTVLRDLGQLPVPDSLKEVHNTYIKAVNFYADASADMMKIAADGNEQHLLDAHTKTNQAGTLMLKVSAELWPTATKPK